jgi:hypothetical protein
VEAFTAGLPGRHPWHDGFGFWTGRLADATGVESEDGLPQAQGGRVLAERQKAAAPAAGRSAEQQNANLFEKHDLTLALPTESKRRTLRSRTQSIR